MKTVSVTLENNSKIIKRTIKTKGSAPKAAKALAYSTGLTMKSYEIVENTCTNQANS